jgi:hypothetical protein
MPGFLVAGGSESPATRNDIHILLINRRVSMREWEGVRLGGRKLVQPAPSNFQLISCERGEFLLHQLSDFVILEKEVPSGPV